MASIFGLAKIINKPVLFQQLHFAFSKRKEISNEQEKVDSDNNRHNFMGLVHDCAKSHQIDFDQQSLYKHEFFEKLVWEKLSGDAFMHFIEQDKLYLDYFSRYLGLLSANLPKNYSLEIYKIAEKLFVKESRSLQYYSKLLGVDDNAGLNKANAEYTRFLLNSIIRNSKAEVALASFYPCLHLYYKMGLIYEKNILKNRSNVHLFQPLLETFISNDFRQSVSSMENVLMSIFTSYKTTDEDRLNIIKLIEKGFKHERNFLNSVIQYGNEIKIEHDLLGLKNSVMGADNKQQNKEDEDKNNWKSKVCGKLDIETNTRRDLR
jgi:thiaminase